MSMYAVTDGLSGLNAGPDDPGTGHNFLVHNMCRLPGSDGTWMIAARRHGHRLAHLRRRRPRRRRHDPDRHARSRAVTVDGGAASGVVLADGRAVAARVVLGACDPYRLMDLVPDGALPARADRRGWRRSGGPAPPSRSTWRCAGLPRFSCLPDGRAAPVRLDDPPAAGLGGLAGGGGESPMAALRAMWADVQAGRLPAEPTIEWYLHTTVDPSLQRRRRAPLVGAVRPVGAVRAGRHDLGGGAARLRRPAAGDLRPVRPGHLRPGRRRRCRCTPPGIEEHFGITGGHIHHVDNTVSFTDRMPYATGLSTGSTPAAPAATRPAASSAPPATTPPAASSPTWAAEPSSSAAGRPERHRDPDRLECRPAQLTVR